MLQDKILIGYQAKGVRASSASSSAAWHMVPMGPRNTRPINRT